MAELPEAGGLIPDPAQGRWVLVAGATGWIGRAVAGAVAAAGRDVVVHSGRRPAMAVDLARELTAVYGVRTVPVDADITDAEQLGELQGALGRAGIGSLAALVNCATGFCEARMPPGRPDHAEFRRILDVDLVGPYLLIRALLPLLAAAGASRVVLLTTRVASPGGAGTAHLSAAKAGVHGLVSALAGELDEYGVQLDALAPGPVGRPGHRPAGLPPGVTAATREEVARMVVELVSA
jgi:3-oxoacyl-[acyl-carrier protein] reductase